MFNFDTLYLAHSQPALNLELFANFKQKSVLILDDEHTAFSIRIAKQGVQHQFKNAEHRYAWIANVVSDYYLSLQVFE